MKNSKNWTWTELHSSHLPLLVKLISAIEDFDEAPIRTAESEIMTYFDDSHVWKAQGAWDGQTLIAFGLARAPQIGSGDSTITLSGGVLPHWRSQGLGAELLERQIRVARDIAQNLASLSPRALLYIESDYQNFSQLALARGFTRQATFVQVRGRTQSTYQLPDISEYVKIHPLGDGHIDDIRRIHNATVAESPLFDVHSVDSWTASLAHLDREWCLVAYDTFGDRPRVVGYLLASVFTSVIDGQETADAYIDEVVVVPQWRDSGVGSALVYTALQNFHVAGYPAVVADVAVYDPQGTPFADIFDVNDFVELGRTHVMALNL
ncbi:GNAT family N-acetyltransferase [Arcanobacterium phocisimile]|uniref:GNAT family N-acetyltransferase n=1 Tax=Arcanobacterium phocisimile TaxID=1302235 RepID=A0ABX7IM37_9ACTO|nr:GNAT family N-acetyltransferase [Arcanobacterium phocisimile]QRV02873.1 GNAT family N-acetyltransferase [Arcanobacterium phocisimile]